MNIWPLLGFTAAWLTLVAVLLRSSAAIVAVLESGDDIAADDLYDTELDTMVDEYIDHILNQAGPE